MLLKDQGDVCGETPMPTDRVDDTSVVNSSTSETVTWLFLDTGAFASATGEVAGTICTGKLTYDGVTNSMGSNLGNFLDTSLTWAAATRVKTLVTCPKDILSKMTFMSETDQIATITPYLTTAGDYIIDHRRGQVWMNALDTVANDSATYKYKTPLTGGGAGDKVDVIKVGGIAPPVDNATATATPTVLMTGAIYKNALDTYADNDATPIPTTANGVPIMALTSGASLTPIFDTAAHKGFVQLTNGTLEPVITAAATETLALATDYLTTAGLCYGMDSDNAGAPILAAMQVAVDNTTISATPNVLVTGGAYKAALDTYNDNDASPFHMDVNGLLKTTETPSASAESAPSAFRTTDLDETPAQAIKAGAGNVYGWNFYNPNSYDVFVKFYNTAQGSVTVGTTAVVETVQVPSLGSVVIKESTPIKSFSTAITIAATKLVADSDTTALDSDVFAQVYYK